MIALIWDRERAERIADAAMRDSDVDAGVFTYRHSCGATAFGVTITSRDLAGDIVMQTITTYRV